MIKKVYNGNNFLFKPSRLRTLIFGLVCSVTFAFATMLIVSLFHENVSIAYIFVLPMIMGAIPVFFSTHEQLKAYKDYLIIPWLAAVVFFLLCFIPGFEGAICLIVIIGPFFLLGTIGAFISKFIRLKKERNQTPLYCSLLIPFIVLAFEILLPVKNQLNTVTTQTEIYASRQNIWNNVVNVKNIRNSEIETHFIHLIGIPKPINGEIDKQQIGGVRNITWEKGIKFKENITTWNTGKGFNYDIVVDPKSIPPTTLDEHVMIGGRYFDVLHGGYNIDSIGHNKFRVTLICTYRVTTNLNFYSKLWANFILDDFNNMIIEVIKKRSEKTTQGQYALRVHTISKMGKIADELSNYSNKEE